MSLFTSVTFQSLTFLPHWASFCLLLWKQWNLRACPKQTKSRCKLRSLLLSKAPGLLYFPALQTRYKHNPAPCWYQTHEYNLHFMWKITFFSSSLVSCWTRVTTGGHQGSERDLCTGTWPANSWDHSGIDDKLVLDVWGLKSSFLTLQPNLLHM